MQTPLRKMGNSAGIIVPRVMLTEMGATIGVKMDMRVENGRLIATPLRDAPREGWAAGAAAIAAEPDRNGEWCAFGNAEDAELEW